jgi:site-specific recombinase XerD
MTSPIVIISTSQDIRFADWLKTRLMTVEYTVVISTVEDSQKNTDSLLKTALAVLVVTSPDSAASDVVMQHVTFARQYDRVVIPTVIRQMSSLPWYLSDLQPENFLTESDRAYDSLLRRLPAPSKSTTFGNARDAYLQRATLKSQHTISAYTRSIELFFEFLSEHKENMQQLPIQYNVYISPEEIPLTELSEGDAPIFLHFAEWLLSPSSGAANDYRPYKPSTVELRLAGVQNWFQFLDDHGWLPPQFHLAKAKRIVRDELRARPRRSGPAQPPEYIEEVIYYYDILDLPDYLRKPDVSEDRVRRWELTRLRNKTLLHCLAETGGRISEILSLNISDFPERYLLKSEVLRVEVIGKGGHSYMLRFLDSLPAIRAYIQTRGANLRAIQNEVPLFISHDNKYDGSRMSRIVAWRVVDRAARALGLRSITPHDFRHWRATQLLNAGHSLDVVQDYLGHRSVETTRIYYARTDPLRVDEAAQKTRLPHLDDEA